MEVSDPQAVESVEASQAPSAEVHHPREPSRPQQHLSEADKAAQENSAHYKELKGPNERADAHRRQLRETARAKSAQLLREARGIDEPRQSTKEQPTQSPSGATPSPQTAPRIPAGAEAAQQAEAHARETTRLRYEAQQAESKAKERIAQAERLVELAKTNPVEWLEAQNLTLDEWNARLLNGGQETNEQALLRQVREEAAKAQEAVRGFEERQRQADSQRLQQTALDTLKPALERDYPMVETLLGAKGAYDHLAQLAKNSQGKEVDYAAALDSLENQLFTQQKALLQNSKIAAKMGLSVDKPSAEIAESQSPRTLTNKVTSSSAPSGARHVPGSREDILAKRQRAIALMRSYAGS